LSRRKFVNPWPNAELDHRSSAFFRWQWQRIRKRVPSDPPVGSFPVAQPAFADPRADEQECRLTWLGHASFLLQIGGRNILLDPVLSERASPFANVGPSRLVRAPLTVEQLPPIDAVLLSHDHYDHLDNPTVVALKRRFGTDLKWVTPLGYRDWFAKRGVHAVVELDWWESAELGKLYVTATPAQHWTRRGWASFQRLWCSYMIRAPRFSAFFCGDSGYCPAFKEIGARFGPCDIAMLPIGAYEPRWFMKAAHMNPEEAVQTFLDLNAHTFVPMHWGTFRLTDEDMLEPPQRLRAAWTAAGLSNDRLALLQHGETLRQDRR
jgi:N-acyl-phosphatidylethanolamine-hydrolysing phospholipase D